MSTPSPLQPATVRAISSAYSLSLASDLIRLRNTPYSRVVERVNVRVESCKREISVDWTLPSLEEALPGSRPDLSAANLAMAADNLDYIVVPITLIRRGQLLSYFSLSLADGSPVYLCSKDEADKHTDRVLGLAWVNFESKVRAQVTVDADRRLLSTDIFSELGRRYIQSYKLLVDKSDAELQDIFERLRKFEAINAELASLGELVSVARFFARRYLFWARIQVRPGNTIRLSYSYVTRFAAEYLMAGSGFISRASRVFDNVGRFVGQQPNRYMIPISRYSQAKSYHCEVSIPESCYIQRQAFVLKQSLGRRAKKQDKDLEEYVERHKSSISGGDESGGVFAHLYSFRMPAEVRNPVFTFIKFSERPPGLIGVIFWMSLSAALATGMFFSLWDQIIRGTSHGVDIVAVFVAVPALAAIWFGRAISDENRARIPLIGRLGVVVTALSTVYALFCVLVRRGVCTGAAEDSKEIAACPSWAETLTARNFVMYMFCVVVATSMLLLAYRLSSQIRYRKHQRVIYDKYGE
jgi:hypothetical protein